MEVKAERQENCIVKLTVSVDEKREDELLRKAARSLSRNYRIHGFRPGKAPYSVVVNRLGVDAVRAQALDQFGEDIFQEGLKESALLPVDQASLQDVTWEPLTLHLTVPVGPEVSLGNFRDIRISWEEPQVTDEDLDQELLRLQKGQKEWRPDNRPAELGDQVVLDITGAVGGDVVLENKDREMILKEDSPYPVPGFAAAVVGMKPEETREFDLVYPQDHYNPDVAGKEAHLTAYLKEIKVEVLPLLDDEFAMSVGDYESLDDLKTQLGQSLLEQAEKAAEEAYEEQIWQRLLGVASIEYPQVFVDREVDATQRRIEQQLGQQGIELATYFQLTNTTEEAWKAEARTQAEERVKRNLLLAQIIQETGIKAENDEIDAELDKVVGAMGERADEMREMLASPGGRMTLAESVVTRKAWELLKSIARGQEAERTAEAVEDQAAETAVEDETQSEAEIDTKTTTYSLAPSEEEGISSTETGKVAPEDTSLADDVPQ